MSLDGAFLHIVKTELETAGLINSRVEKIHQPSREELVLSLRTKSGAAKLLVSANPSSARVCLTESPAENPMTPPMFCQLLRKKLSGGRLLEITQDGFERIVSFKFLCYNEIGDEEKITLTAEIMGRSSNIILLIEKDDKLRIIDAIKRVTDEVSSIRRVLPGLAYELPPREKRLMLTDFTKEELSGSLQNYANQRLDKALIKIFEGICPLFAREVAFRASGFTDISTSEVFLEKLYEVLLELRDVSNPVMLTDSDKKPFDFTFVNIMQYGSLMNVVPFETANKLLDSFFRERADANRRSQRSGGMLKTLNNRYERVLRKIDARRADLAACKEAEKFRKWGDLINANLYNVQKGADVLVAEDYDTGEEIKIPLDPKLTPAKNAQKYYAEYKKLQTAEKTLTELIKESRDELLYLDSVIEAASRAETDSQLLEIKRELIETNFLVGKKQSAKPGNSKKSVKQEKPSEPMKFISSDGTTILVGRNNRQNDILTLKTAKPREIWLHTKDIAGSHVIIRAENPSEKTLTEAAQIAAYCSKGRNSSQVPVDYTEARYVKKPSGAKPGMVIFTNNRTLYVTPDEGVYEGLRT